MFGRTETAAKQLVARILSAAGMLMPHPLAGREGRVHGTRDSPSPGHPASLPTACAVMKFRFSLSSTPHNVGPPLSAPAKTITGSERSQSINTC